MTKKRYTVKELVAQCDPDAQMPEDLKARESTPSVGHEDIDNGSSHVTPADGNVFLDLGFEPEEAERLLMESDRAIVERRALKIFGDQDKAQAWLSTYNQALGATPSSMLDTRAGINAVRKLLVAIATGGAV